VTAVRLSGADSATEARWALSREEIEAFVYREARLADEHDYDGWEALWTDDATYWVPAGGGDIDPLKKMSIIYDNRRRIATRLNQLRTGRRFAQSPPSHMRRVVSNLEVVAELTNAAGGTDTVVAANFVLVESRPRGTEVWAGRTTYHLRREGTELKLAYKKVVLVNSDKILPTLAFLI
jgi:benzoate/toluate 1,2-dioxygenase beta subunit